MNKMSSVKRATVTAACIALCYILPMAFHSLGLGGAFSPMHIPVLLCGIICGGGYGLLCGMAGPLVSSVLSGMPSATGLIFMVPELMVYGLVSGLAMKLVRTGKVYGDLYIALIAAMLLGRVAGGIASALMRQLMTELRAIGSEKLTLEVRASNMPARGLYAKLGFVQVGLRKNYYRDPKEDALILSISLKEGNV